MGAWGTAPLENDGALDFLGDLGDVRKAGRAAKVRAAFDAYLDFDRRLQAGDNVSVMSAEETAELLASREAALEANAHDLAGLFALMPEYATPERWAAYVRTMAQPQVEDGSLEAEHAIGAAWAVAARLGAVPAGDQAHHLQALSPAELSALAALAQPALQAIVANPLLRASWYDSFDDWAAHLDALRQALANAAG
jgi:hypothetical protein